MREFSVKRLREGRVSYEFRPPPEPMVRVQNLGVNHGQRLSSQVAIIGQPLVECCQSPWFRSAIGPGAYGLAEGFGEISQNRSTLLAFHRFGLELLPNDRNYATTTRLAPRESR